MRSASASRWSVSGSRDSCLRQRVRLLEVLESKMASNPGEAQIFASRPNESINHVIVFHAYSVLHCTKS